MSTDETRPFFAVPPTLISAADWLNDHKSHTRRTIESDDFSGGWLRAIHCLTCNQMIIVDKT